MKNGYEILSFRDTNGEMYKLNKQGNYTNCLNSKKHIFELDDLVDYLDGFIEIFSVKRTSDGMIFRLSNFSLFSGSILRIDLEPVTFDICIYIKNQDSICPLIISK